MPDPGTKALLLLAALITSGVGLGWLALAMEVHWAQVRGAAARGTARVGALRAAQVDTLRASQALALRVLGAAALSLSLALCLRADHATIGALVWVMTLAAGALAIAFTLAWRPRVLAWLVGWMG
jgi:hypothetical protein